ncbi:MAG: TIGR02300 family protein [Alphaproteobacteria bacterium]
MPKASLGAKRICPNCHVPFYDLSKNPAHCPNCAHEFDPTEALKGRRTRGNEPVAKAEEVKQKAPPKDADAVEAGDTPESEEAEEADDELLEDASDLGEDEDDVSEVIENVDEAGEER